MDISSIIIDDEPHAIAELSDIIGSVPGISLVAHFESVASAVVFLEDQKQVDVIFCDINMPGLNGIQAAKLLHRYCDSLIYVTAYREYALDAFGVHASGYLLKPVSQQALIDKVAELIEQRNKRQRERNDEVIFIKGNQKNSFIKINLNEIIYIEAMLNYISINTRQDKYITYMGLKDVDEQFRKYDHFQRISRSVIVNIDEIKMVDGNTIRLTGDNSFTIGDSYRSAFHAYMRKRTLNS